MRMMFYIRPQVVSRAQHEEMALFGQVWPVRTPFFKLLVGYAWDIYITGITPV